VADGVVIDLSEVAGVAALLDNAPKQAAKVVRASGVVAIRGMKSGAQAAAPRGKTGWLAESGIRTKSWPDHFDLFTIDNPAGVNEGFYAEYGTSRTPPRPFLRQQLEPGAAVMADLIVAGVDPLKP